MCALNVWRSITKGNAWALHDGALESLRAALLSADQREDDRGTLLCHLNCLGDSFAQRPMRSRIRKSLLLEQPNDLFRPASPKQNNVLRNIDHLKQGREIKILVCAAGNENDRLRDTLQSLYRRMSFKPANRIRMFGLRRS